MNAHVTPFAFEDHLVRVVMRESDPWFVAADICRVLGIQNPAQVVAKLDDDERGYVQHMGGVCSTYASEHDLNESCGDTGSIRTPGGDQSAWIVSESGLYTIVLRSRAATTPGSVAHRFRKWVTGEVLPQIRRTGRYETPEAEAPPSSGFAILPGHPDFSQAVRLVREARLSRGCNAALSVWREVGLPWVPELDNEPARPAAPMEDAVARFALEGLERVPGILTPGSVIYDAYRSFCIRHGLANTGENSFFVRFARMGFTKRRINKRYSYLGVRPLETGTSA